MLQVYRKPTSDQMAGQVIEATVLRGWTHDSYRLKPETLHRFWAIDGPAVVLEVSTKHNDYDVYRLEESKPFGTDETTSGEDR